MSHQSGSECEHRPIIQSALKYLTVACLLFVAGCDVVEPLRSEPGALVGTRANIKMHGRDVVAEVTRVIDKLVTMEFRDWRGGIIREVNLYRGLFPVSGTDQGLRYESNFDESTLESLFPLKVGKTIGVSGTMYYVDGGESADFYTHVEVVGEKTVDLKNGPRRTFVVQLEWEFSWNGITRTKTDTVHFDPETSMVLKSVIRGENFQNYWVVVSVDEPENPNSQREPRNRRSGTVMI